MPSRLEARPAAGEALARRVDDAADHRRQLAVAPAGLDLPTDFPRQAVPTFAGAVRAAQLGAELTAELRRFCRREGVTPFMLLLAVFDVLLARWSGQGVHVGSPGAHRDVLALRTDLGDVASFRELLRHVREKRRFAGARPDLSLEWIDAGAVLRLRLEYNADLFAPATACRLLGNLSLIHI